MRELPGHSEGENFRIPLRLKSWLRCSWEPEDAPTDLWLLFSTSGMETPCTFRISKSASTLWRLLQGKAPPLGFREFDFFEICGSIFRLAVKAPVRRDRAGREAANETFQSR